MNIFKTAIRWWLLGSMALAGFSYFVWIYTADSSSATEVSACEEVDAAAERIAEEIDRIDFVTYPRTTEERAAVELMRSRYRVLGNLAIGNPECFSPEAVASAQTWMADISRH